MKRDYHQNQLTKIKKNIGASFVSFVERKGEYFLRVRKGGEETDFEFNGTLNQLSPQAYLDLEQSLMDFYGG